MPYYYPEDPRGSAFKKSGPPPLVPMAMATHGTGIKDSHGKEWLSKYEVSFDSTGKEREQANRAGSEEILLLERRRWNVPNKM